MKAFIFFISVSLGFLFSTFSQANTITDNDGISYTIREIEPNRLVELDNILVTVDGNKYGLYYESKLYYTNLYYEYVYKAADLLCSKIGFKSAIKTNTPKEWKAQFMEKNRLKGVVAYRLAYLDNRGGIGLLSDRYNDFTANLPVIKSVICQK